MESYFVKLEPPYQIIHYGGEAGIQIDTLITVGNMYPDSPQSLKSNGTGQDMTGLSPLTSLYTRQAQASVSTQTVPSVYTLLEGILSYIEKN